METKIINCKQIAENIRQNLSDKIKKIQQEKNITPALATIIVGNDPASKSYVKNKEKVCTAVGIKSFTYEMDESTSQEELLKLIDDLNTRNDVHGILVQVPLPKHIDEDTVAKRIDINKDVDCFNPENAGKLFRGQKCIHPCTPKGIVRILKETGIEIQGKKAVVIGRSNIVGKPAAMLLLNDNATVTICHSRTKDLKSQIKDADIVVSAVGKIGLIKGDMLKSGAAVVDAGTTMADGKLKGDVDFDSALGIAEYITPVPGGVGAMTTTMLIENVLEAFEKNE